MSASVVVSGLEEFLRNLLALPEDLNRDGFAIVQGETEGAAIEIRQEYGRQFKQHTGNLANSVHTFYPKSEVLVGIVRSLAPHAHLVEWGTRARSYKGQSRGAMSKPSPTITPTIARRRRARMARALVDMVKRYNFEVTAGDADATGA